MRRIATLGARVLRSNLGRSPQPFKLTLIVTWTCDTRCRMCNIWQRDKKGVMTLDEVRTFFERNPYFSWVNLSGGEIWTRPDAADLVQTVIDGSPDLYLLDFPTTGQQTDRIVEGVRRILASPVPRTLVTVSLDGPRETHEDVRGVKGAFDRALATFRALRALRSSRFDVFLGVTLSNFNEGRLFDTVDAVRAEIPDVSLREFHVNLAQISAHYYGNAAMDPTTADALGDLEEFVRRRGSGLHPVAWLERQYQERVRSFLETGRTPVPCKALASSVFVDARWNVYPCSMWDAPLGNLRDHGFDLAPLWSSGRTASLQREIESGRCPNCWTPCEAYQTILGNLAR